MQISFECSLLTHDETFKSWWDSSLPGWQFPIHSVWGFAKWIDDYDNDVNCMLWQMEDFQSDSTSSAKHQLRESLSSNTAPVICRIYKSQGARNLDGSRRHYTLTLAYIFYLNSSAIQYIILVSIPCLSVLWQSVWRHDIFVWILSQLYQ